LQKKVFLEFVFLKTQGSFSFKSAKCCKKVEAELV